MLVGHEYEGAVTLVRILIVASSLTAVRRVLTEGARGRGEPGIGSIAELTAWIVFLPAVAVFGAAWEAEGVAWAMVVSSLAGLFAIVVGTGRRRKANHRSQNSLVTANAPTEGFPPADQSTADASSARAT